MRSEHTPTPWSLTGKATIKATNPTHGSTTYIATMENNSRRAANAGFIVRAVNCHDDLVAALTNSARHIRAWAMNFDVGVDVLREIDAALAKAESAL